MTSDMSVVGLLLEASMPVQLVMLLLILASLIIFAGGSVLAPLIYPFL